MKSIDQLEIDERQELAAVVSAPFGDLKARIGRLVPPFDYLKSVKAAFDPVARFILNRTLEGDEDALAARQARVEYDLAFARLCDGERAEHMLKSYMARHQSEINFVREQQYGWMSNALNDGSEFEKPANLDAMLDSIIGESLGEYGFDIRRRKRKKSEWRCPAVLAGESAEIEIDKGNWKMNAVLRIPTLPHSAGVGSPFFGSSKEFYYGRQRNFEEQVRSFFVEYAKIFPHIIEAVEKAKPIRDAYLSGDVDRAYALARRSAGLDPAVCE